MQGPMANNPLIGGPTSRNRQEIERGTLLRQIVSIPVTTVTNSNTTLHTVTDGKFFYMEAIGVCNISGGALAITVYAVASGGAAGNSNKVYDGYSLAANATGILALGGSIFEPGTAIIAVTDSATGGNFWLSGYEAIGGDFL